MAGPAWGAGQSWVELRRAGHAAELQAALQPLVTREAYWNVLLFCHDGTVAHNRLVAGLLFPQLRDEVYKRNFQSILIICPR